MVELFYMDSNIEVVSSDSGVELENLLRSEFSAMFTPLSELSCSREHDHTIPIKSGARPVNLSQYKYSHIQKDEIEKLVQELLQSEFIRS